MKNKKAKRRRRHKLKMFKLGQALPEGQPNQLMEKTNENKQEAISDISRGMSKVD